MLIVLKYVQHIFPVGGYFF